MRLAIRVLSALVWMSAVVHADPIPQRIAKGTVRIELQPIATGLTSPVYLTAENANRLFVVDQSGQIRVIQYDALLPQPFLDITSRTHDGGEAGLLGLAFDPGFADPLSPGYHTLYTYGSEAVAGVADLPIPMPVGTPIDHQNVLTQWRVDAADPNRVDPASRREMLRFDHPQNNHDGGTIAFGPDGLLYLSIGDGGNFNDIGPGHTPGGNAQDLSRGLGKILRIDVRGNSSRNGQYGIPRTNPLICLSDTAKEAYAWGLRNPYRFSFDSANGDLIVADAGQANIEEIDRIVWAGNYGWPFKEGTFAFDRADASISTDVSALPSNLIDPILQYDHDEGSAVIGGFVYHGAQVPDLQNLYVFGDFNAGATGGRLFYANLSEAQIKELIIGVMDRPLTLRLKGFGQDAQGELYILGNEVGSNAGVVYRVVHAPLPAPLAAGSIGLALAAAAGYRWRRCNR